MDGFLTRGDEGFPHLTRKEFVKQLAIFSAAFVASCSPLRVVLRAYASKYESGTDVNELTLRAFVVTIIPGADRSEADLVRMFADTYYEFHSYCGFFVADLSERSQKLFGTDRFDSLSSSEQTNVVNHGLAADETVSRIYRAAILVAQVSYYGGIYDDSKGCTLIDFPGANYGYGGSELHYAKAGHLLAPEITSDGNYS